MSSDFYRAFEDKHRGPRETIKARLEVYLPFVHGVAGSHRSMRVLDLGCGRGEWLELMKEHGIDAEGVDLDAKMLKACEDLDLKVVTSDALKHLQAQPEGSIGVVSAFHLAEHLPFETLQRLVEEARRALIPGGLLIMETPNPENLVVGSANFYLDPTHIRPIPAPLLAFLPEYYGFARWKVLGLQEPKGLESEQPVTLANVLRDVSPDYAVIAQVPGESAQLPTLREAFAEEYGVSLTGLTQRFDQGLQARFAEMRSQVSRIKEDYARALSEHVKAMEERVAAEERAQHAELRSQRLLERAHKVEEELATICRSRSWRITAPMRHAGLVIRMLHPRRARGGIAVMLRRAILFVKQRPRMIRAIRSLLVRFPSAEGWLRRMAWPNEVVARDESPVPSQSEPQPLTPRARQILNDLELAIERRRKDRL